MTKPKFLHLIPDDKFIDDARELFEKAAPGQNDYLLLSQRDELLFIRTFTPVRREVTAALQPDVLKHLADYDAVFIHYLNTAARLVVDRAPASTNFVWLGWGADYYHLICTPDELLMPATKELMSKIDAHNVFIRRLNTARSLLKYALRGVLHPLWAFRRLTSFQRLRQIGPNQLGEQVLLARFQALAPVLIEDYEAIKRRIPDFRPRFVQWNYPSLGSVSQPTMQCVHGRNILLGNSATPANNHLDTFHLIRGVIGSECQIICPLSYGTQAYGDAVASVGYEMFGSRFNPLRQFLEADLYAATLSTCSIVAMNHVRQQALGNILMMLWLGAYVFLNHQSPIIGAMKRLGIHVFDIRVLPDFLQHPRRPISEDQIMDIRDRLTRRYGHAALLTLTRKLLEKCAKEMPRNSIRLYSSGEN